MNMAVTWAFCIVLCTAGIPCTLANSEHTRYQPVQTHIRGSAAENLTHLAYNRGSYNSYRIGGSTSSYLGRSTYRHRGGYRKSYGNYKRAYRHHGKRWTYSKHHPRYRYPKTRYYRTPYYRPYYRDNNRSYYKPYRAAPRDVGPKVSPGYRFHNGRYWSRYAGVIPATAAVLYYTQNKPSYACLASYNNYEYEGIKYADGPCVIDYLGKKIGINNHYIQMEN